MMAAIENAHTRAAFLHFFDVHFLELKQAELYEREVAQEARLATRLALVSSDQVLVPAASYFETRICREIVREFTPIFKDGTIWLVGGAANIGEFIYNKLRQYDPQSQQYREYSTVDLSGLPPFRSRTQSSTRDIKTRWIEELNAERSPHVIADGTGFTIPKDFERRWEQVPVNLEGKAFIVSYVAPLLLGNNQHPTVLNRLHYVINEAYFGSYVTELQACTVQDLIYLASPHPVPSIGAPIYFRTLLKQLRREGMLQPLMNCSPEELITLKNDERWIRCLLNTTAENMHNGSMAHQIVGKEIKKMEALRSFIVHGHDTTAKLELKDYLQNTLGLPEPIILHQQPNRGRTVIEKFEEYSEDIDVAFVLLTPDDIGGISDGDLRERARQNVIFELGIFIGRFGRLSGRVILLHKGDLEIPSDLTGVIYIDICNGIEAAGENIRKELLEIDRQN